MPYYNEEKEINSAYPIAIFCLFFPTLLYLFTGISMVSHYYQFLTPLVFLILSILPGQILNFILRKIALVGILLILVVQGSFSYWRAFEEHNSPYLHDIGYTKVLAKVVARECFDNPNIRFVSENGFKLAGEMFWYRFGPELSTFKVNGSTECKSLLIFQNKLFAKSPIISWYLEQLKPLMKFEEHNNQIWIMGY